MSYRTAYDARLDHIDALAAQAARRRHLSARLATVRAVSFARTRGVCSPCIHGAPCGGGDIPPCHCAPVGQHGPAL